MATFNDVLSEAIAGDRLLKAVLSRTRRDAAAAPGKVVVRPIRLKDDRAYQFAIRTGGKETHENLPPADTAHRILQWCETTFADCHVFTPDAEYSIRTGDGGRTRIKRKPVDRPPTVELDHNRAKPYLIPDGTPCPFLIGTGVMTAGGNVRAAKQHKFRQINRFLELVNDVVPSLPPEGRLNVVDFGCGKSYLTFALHHLLTVIHRRDAAIVGLDSNPDVIARCAELTGRLGLRGLSFRRQDIRDFAGMCGGERVDLVVSLHACDTATDDALAQAVRWGAGVIFAVPCCQHEIAAQITGGELAAVTRHGILKERFAALATDALRAELLEQHGYRTQVVEFIDLEHTDKNVLIRAVRRTAEQPSGVSRTESLRQLKELLGISRFHLEDALES